MAGAVVGVVTGAVVGVVTGAVVGVVTGAVVGAVLAPAEPSRPVVVVLRADMIDWCALPEAPPWRALVLGTR
jgi:hypothetical protein